MLKKKRRSLTKFFLLTIIVSLIFVCVNYFFEIKKIENARSITDGDLTSLNKTFKHGVISLKQEASTAASSQVTLDFKLFNLFRIKKINKVKQKEVNVFLSGDVFDFDLKINGVMVKEIADVKCQTKTMAPLKNSGLKVGDIITKVNGEKVQGCQDFIQKIEQSQGEVKLSFLQNKKEKTALVLPAIDQFGIKKIGVWIKDDTQGTGTLSFVEEGTGKFVALGHSILDCETGAAVDVSGGDVKGCEVVGVRKSARGVVGELRTIPNSKSQSVGEVLGLCDKGLFGSWQTKEVPSQIKMPVAGVFETKIGKAQIYCTVSNEKAKFFDVEIVKCDNAKNNKNLTIKISDPNLLVQTGGIVQGMSGSPIVQNGKLVGVLTHCFINDPSRGFAVFASRLI